MCVAAAMMASLLRRQQQGMAMALTLAAGAAALAMLSGQLGEAAQAMLRIAGHAGLDGGSARTLLSAACIALGAEFVAQLCEDAGEKTLGTRAALAARVAMLALAAPTLSELIGMVSEALL